MRTIWKFPIDLGDLVTVVMPAGATVIHVDTQGGHLTMWAEVDSRHAPEERHFVVVGTGHPVPDLADEHVASWQQGPFVWHLYTVGERGL